MPIEFMTKKYNTEVDIFINEEQGIVFAELTACTQPELFTIDLLKEKLELAEVAHWNISDSALNDVFNKVKKGQHGKVVLGNRKDADAELVISDDLLQAFLRVTAAKGGKTLDVDIVTQMLLEKGIHKKRILAEGVQQACATELDGEFEVAKGKPAVNGLDSQFVRLIEMKEEREFTPDEYDRVDYWQGFDYKTVTEGTPLMRRMPPEPGKMGIDIYGNFLQPIPGNEIEFDDVNDGAVISSEDENLVVATTDGHPVYLQRSVRVDPTLQFQDVDIATGHVDFSGSVQITGDVRPGMRVKASGDIHIKGMIERAALIAGGTITIAGGAVGAVKEEGEPESDEEPIEFACQLVADEGIHVRFLNQVKASANVIEVREYIFNSHIHANDRILVGQNGGNGKLIGGKNSAGQAVIAKIIGNKAYNRTTVHIGPDHDAVVKHKKLKFIRKKRLEQLFALKALNEATQQELEKEDDLDLRNKKDKIISALNQLNEILVEIDERIAELNITEKTKEEHFIQATKRIFPNSHLSIYDRELLIEQEFGPSIFAVDGKRVVKQ